MSEDTLNQLKAVNRAAFEDAKQFGVGFVRYRRNPDDPDLMICEHVRPERVTVKEDDD